jgi:hypothetical protein
MTPIGRTIAIVSLGIISAGCGGHWTGPHWAGNPSAPFAETPRHHSDVVPREEHASTEQRSVKEVRGNERASEETPAARLSSPEPRAAAKQEVEADQPIDTVAAAPARPLVPIARREVKVAVHPADVPAEVQGNFARDFPGADVKKVIKKTSGDGQIEYWYLFDDLKYHEHFATYAQSGKLLWDKPASCAKDFFKYDQRPPQNRYTQGSLD